MCPETTAWKLLLSKEGHCSPQETGTALPNSKRNVPTAPKALELVYDERLAPVLANIHACWDKDERRNCIQGGLDSVS